MTSKKVYVDVNEANRLINHGPTVLISTHGKPWDNVMTLAWLSPVSHTPMLVCVAVSKTNWTEELIQESSEFVINVPSIKMMDEVIGCGRVSGRDTNKIQQFQLATSHAMTVNAPLLDDCIAHLECQVVETVDAGDHTLFIAKAEAASADPEVFDGVLRMDARHKTIHHLGGQYYTTPADVIRTSE